MDYWQYLTGGAAPQSQLAAPREMNPGKRTQEGLRTNPPRLSAFQTTADLLRSVLAQRMRTPRPVRRGIGQAGPAGGVPVAPAEPYPVALYGAGQPAAQPPSGLPMAPAAMGREFGDVMPPFGPRRIRPTKRIMGY